MASQCVAVGNGRCYSGGRLRSSVDFIAFAKLETHSPCISALRCPLSALRKTSWLRCSWLTFNVHFPPFLFLFPLNLLLFLLLFLLLSFHVPISLDWTTQWAFWWTWVFFVLFLSGIQILRDLIFLREETVARSRRRLVPLSCQLPVGRKPQPS